MAMGFDSYAPHPSLPGAYNFYPNGGGNPALFAGDAAERLKRSLDLAPPPDPQTLAQNSPNAASLMPQGDPSQMRESIQQMHDAGGAPARPPQLAHAAPAPAGDPRSLSTPMEVAGQEAAQGAPAAPAKIQRTLVPPAGQQAGSLAPAAPQDAGLSNLDQMYKVVHSKGGWSPSAQKVVTEGGVQDPEMQKLMGAAYSDQMRADASAAAATQAHQQAILEASKVEAANAAAEAAKLEQAQVKQRATLQTGADEFNRVMGIKQAELADTSKREVDQFRTFRGKPGAQIGAALAAGLGAFGASLGHNQNFALDIINKTIDNDIQAQREEINRGVASKQNDIQRIKDKYNVDTTVAEKLLSISLTERAQALARKQAAVQGGQEAQMKLDTLNQQLTAKRLQDLKDLQQTMYGKAAITAEQKYHAGGDAVVLTPQVKGRVLASEAAGKVGKGIGEAAKGEYEAIHEGAAPPKAGAGGPGKAPARLSGSLAINESALEDVDNFLKDRPKGTVRRPMAAESFATGRAFTSDERDKIDTMVTAITGKIVKGSNDAINEKEAEHFAEMLASPYESVARAGAEELKRALQTTNHALNRAIDRSRGGGGVDAAITDAAEEASANQ